MPEAQRLMSRRAKNQQASAIDILIEKILADKGLDHKLQQYRAWTVWDDVVGPQIARYAQPLRIRGSVLEVRVENATWMQQLQLLKPKILRELNGRLGGQVLDDIFWKRGAIERQVVPETVAPQLPPLTSAQLADIERLTRTIHDSELQQGLKRLLSMAGRHSQTRRQE